MDWLPISWPSGPLQAALWERQARPRGDLEMALQWHEPSALTLLHGTPVNTLVVTWAAGLAEDARQQETLRPLLETCRSKGVQVLGRVWRPADLRLAAARAREAGLAAIIAEDAAPDSLRDYVIPLVPHDQVRWSACGRIVAIAGREWPQVRVSGSSDSVDAGPTGKPWVDANGWWLKMAEALAPRTRFWLMTEPPPQKAVVRAEAYEVALADAAVHGGRWVIHPDAAFQAGLARGAAEAVEVWRKVARAAQFFEQHREWRAWPAAATMGVVSDFAGEGAFLSMEVLNLAARDQLLLRVIPLAGAPAASFEELRSVLYLGAGRPPDELRDGLLSYAQQGGLVIVNAGWKDAPGESDTTRTHRNFDFRRAGKGSIAIAREAWSDPYLLAMECHVLTSYRYDPFRIYNAPSVLGYCQRSPDRRRMLVQLVNYSARPGTEDVTLAVSGGARAARLWQFAQSQPVTLAPKYEGLGAEFYLPPIPSYAAIELEM